MFGNERAINNSGPDSINNTGDGNIFITAPSHPKTLNKSWLYDYCYKFAETDYLSRSKGWTPPSHIPSKMRYNEIDRYKRIFYNVEHYYDDVEQTLQDIPRREIILNTINEEYERFKSSKKWSDKDELCDLVYYYMVNRVEQTENVRDLYRDEAELGIKALMYYAFVKCQLLDPVPQDYIG